MKMRYLGENPELYAREILASFQLRPPIDIYFLCKLFNIEIFFDDLKNVEAFFILKNGKKKIVANNSIMYEKRLKFTISHEIGHYILPWHKNIIYDCKTKDIINFNSYKVEEREANHFASELLIPEKFLHQSLRGKQISLSVLKDLASEYEVSLTSLAIKAVKLSDNPVSVVLSENGRVKWSYKSSSFRRNIINGKLREWCYAYDYFNGKPFDEISETVYSLAWLTDGSFNEGIKEESLVMPNLGLVLTILILPYDEAIEDADFDYNM
jgi:Zn-dependent peptidase ImmA (M78 family)